MVPESAKATSDRHVRILSGVQASGRLHVGNYYGALRQFIELQNDGEALYFIANLHALTTVDDAHSLREYTREAALASALYQLLAITAPPGEFARLDASWRTGGKGYVEYIARTLTSDQLSHTES